MKAGAHLAFFFFPVTVAWQPFTATTHLRMGLPSSFTLPGSTHIDTPRVILPDHSRSCQVDVEINRHLQRSLDSDWDI